MPRYFQETVYLCDQLCRGCVASIDEILSACNEVIKDVLLVVQRARLTPPDAILPSAPATHPIRLAVLYCWQCLSALE